MYLKNFDETWIDGADIVKNDIYINKLVFVLPKISFGPIL